MFAVIFISVVISSISITNQEVKNRMFTSVIDGFDFSNFSNLAEHQNLIIFSPAHDRYVRVAYNIFTENKIIGSGPNTFRLSCKKYSNLNYNDDSGCNTHPHNTYAQILSETGITGISIILLIYVFLIVEFFKYFNKSKSKYVSIHFCLIVYFLIILFPFTPTGNFFNNWVSAIYFLPLGIFLSNLKKL